MSALKASFLKQLWSLDVFKKHQRTKRKIFSTACLMLKDPNNFELWGTYAIIRKKDFSVWGQWRHYSLLVTCLPLRHILLNAIASSLILNSWSIEEVLYFLEENFYRKKSSISVWKKKILLNFIKQNALKITLVIKLAFLTQIRKQSCNMTQ